jgi:hypothetical protein
LRWANSPECAGLVEAEVEEEEQVETELEEATHRR